MSYMAEALALARRGWGQTSPNPLVGAVLVRDGEIVGRGWYTYGGVKHAEVLAIEQAGPLARGATLYVTLEPCSHQGRTPPCADAVVSAGISKVVAAMQDPNPLVSGAGFQRLRASGIEVELASEVASEAERINEPFVHYMRTGRPIVTLKTALTLDGKIAAPDDNRGWITSAVARHHVQQLRHGSDAILTGIGTVLEDDCLMTDRTGMPRSRPLLRIVMDSQLRLPLESRLVRSAAGDLLVAGTSAAPARRKAALEEHGAEVLILDGPGGRADLRGVIGWLGERNYLSLLVEAGSKVNWAVLDHELADKVFFYYAPKILGGTQSLSMAGGIGRRRRADAILVRSLQVHHISPDEFAVEGWLVKSTTSS